MPPHISRALFAAGQGVGEKVMCGQAVRTSSPVPVGYFWHARHSQIYPTLAQLEDDGLVTPTVIAGAVPQPTKRYRVTREGRTSVRRWL